jgi:hypothetical protein
MVNVRGCKSGVGAPASMQPGLQMCRGKAPALRFTVCTCAGLLVLMALVDSARPDTGLTATMSTFKRLLWSLLSPSKILGYT